MTAPSPGDRPVLRGVLQVSRGRPAMDGAGVRLTRLIGTADLEQLDPFLLFDVFESDDPDDYIAGFPPHPHRGFETVTYMLAGRMEHRDSVGNQGVIEAGGVQWMTAARGIIHSEMPRQERGLLRGVQVWVNLPARLKMSAPGYREYDAEAIPARPLANGGRVRLVAGELGDGRAGPVQGVVTEPLFCDLELPRDAAITIAVPSGHSAVLYVAEGAVGVAAAADTTATVPERSLAVLGDGDAVRLHGAAPGNRVLLLAARRLGEPVYRSGPFVMNSAEQIVRAYRDYQDGRLARTFDNY